jgi:hypothetical protein
MVRYIEQQGLEELEDAISIGVDEIKDFFTVCSDGFFEAKPMQIHLCKFKAFLLIYRRKQREAPFKMTEGKVLLIAKGEFN